MCWVGRWAVQGALQVRPCKLDGAIHGANAPTRPTRPTPDSFRARPAHGEEEKINSNSGSLRSWVLHA